MSHINSETSALLCSAYKRHKGKWTPLMEDPEVVATGLPRHKIERHINYKKKKWAYEAAIKDELNDRTGETRETHYSISSSEDSDDLDADPDFDNTAPAPTVKRTKDEADDALFRELAQPVKKAKTDLAVAAQQLPQDLRALDTQEVAPPRPRAPRAEAVESLRKHHNAVEQQATMQTTMQAMTLQLMNRLMQQDDAGGDGAAMRQELWTVRQDVQALQGIVNEVLTTQTQIIALLGDMRRKLDGDAPANQ